MRILGVDPGLAATGYAVVEGSGRSPVVVEAGCVRTSPGALLQARLGDIYESLRAVLERWRPEAVVLEGLYSEYRFPRAAITVGAVRGVVLLACGQAGAQVQEVAPAELKQALTGSGRAPKQQMRRAVASMLGLPTPPSSSHIADAMALGVVGLMRASGVGPARIGRGR